MSPTVSEAIKAALAVRPCTASEIAWASDRSLYQVHAVLTKMRRAGVVYQHGTRGRARPPRLPEYVWALA